MSVWLRGLDLNQRPSGYEPDELPGCSTPRQKERTL
jgi:membrane-bound lytic murein transglycosylase A